MKKYLTETHPQLCKQWHPQNDLLPNTVTYSSHKKVWWICDKHHSWEASISNRAILGNGCPYCAGQKPTPETCLANTHPIIAQNWHPKNKISPKEILPKSNKKVWWKCPQGHEWEESVSNHTRPKQGCPYCSGHRPCSSNCFANIHPELLCEWSQSNTISPFNVTTCSNKKVWWKCQICDYVWETRIAHRTNGHGCPKCKQSKGEKSIEDFLLQKGVKFKKQYRFKSCKNKKPLPFDFIIKTKKGLAAIEYQGEQHYKNCFGKQLLEKIKINDTIKKNWCRVNDLPFLEIHYTDFKLIYEILENFINQFT